MKVFQRRGISFFTRQALKFSLFGSDRCLDVHRRSIPISSSEARSAGDPDRQGLIAFHKARIYPLRFLDHLNIAEALQDFFPDNLQLQLGQPQSYATMNTEPKGDMGARARPIDDEVVGTIDHFL